VRKLLHERLKAVLPELDETYKDRRQMIYMCICGLGTNDPDWLWDHISQNPEQHRERFPWWDLRPVSA
jgi:hypothetical protein